MKLIPALLLCCASVAVSAQEMKIGYVNSERLLREAEPAKRAQAKLQAEFSKRQQDLNAQSAAFRAKNEKFEKEAPTLSENEQKRRQQELIDTDRDLQRRQREFQEDLTQRRNEETAAVVERANRTIHQIAESEKYDLILSDQVVVYNSPRVDITQKVMDALNSGK